MVKSDSARTSFREVLVIVVGVLIALGADAAYGRIMERGQAEGYRLGLEEDLRADSALFALNLGQAALPAQRDAADTLRLVLSSPQLELPPAVILRHVRYSIMLPAGAKTRATFDEIVGAGQLNILAQSELRRGLVAYYSSTLVMHDAPHAGWLSAIYYPYIRELNSIFGVGRFTEMVACDDLECFERISQGDEATLLRSSSELDGLLGGIDILEYTALDPVTVQQQTVNELLAMLR